MRRDELEQGGTTRADEFLFVRDELVVHADDSAAVEAELGAQRSRSASRTVGSYQIWTLTPGPEAVPDLVLRIRRSVAELRVAPHYAFGICQRAPMAAFPPMKTNGRLPSATGESVVVPVGVIDTGFVLHDDNDTGDVHPWMAGRVDFNPESDDDPLEEQGDGLLKLAVGHGTLVAGVVLGEAPSAQIRMVRGVVGGLDSDGAIAGAITELAAGGVRLLNLSFCGDVMTEGGPPPVIANALDQLDEAVVVVAAAGNFGDTRPVWPAASERVISVGAVEEHPQQAAAPFSGHGKWVDAYAPGVSVVGPFLWHQESVVFANDCRAPQHFEGWARGTGSSFAAAIVTGRIAQLTVALGIPPREAAERLLREAPRITVDRLDRPYVASSAKIVAASD